MEWSLEFLGFFTVNPYLLCFSLMLVVALCLVTNAARREKCVQL